MYIHGVHCTNKVIHNKFDLLGAWRWNNSTDYWEVDKKGTQAICTESDYFLRSAGKPINRDAKCSIMSPYFTIKELELNAWLEYGMLESDLQNNMGKSLFQVMDIFISVMLM